MLKISIKRLHKQPHTNNSKKNGTNLVVLKRAFSKGWIAFIFLNLTILKIIHSISNHAATRGLTPCVCYKYQPGVLRDFIVLDQRALQQFEIARRPIVALEDNNARASFLIYKFDIKKKNLSTIISNDRRSFCTCSVHSTTKPTLPFSVFAPRSFVLSLVLSAAAVAAVLQKLRLWHSCSALPPLRKPGHSAKER